MGKARQGDAERYGMSGSAMSSQQDEARLGHDKQLLVQHTLHQYQRAGGKVAGLPIGFDSIQELQQWATDSIDVRQLLKLIADRRPVYLDQLYTASHSLVGNGAGQKAAAVHRVWPERPAAAPAGAAAPVGPAAPEEELPELRLEALETDVDTDSLQEFAFLVFCACCGEVCSPGLLHSVRQQLCISQQQGEALLQSLGHVGVVPDATVLGAAGMRGRAGAASPDLISVTEVQASWDRSAVASLQLPLHLLRSLLPTSFHRFQQYARVRDMLLAVLVNSLVRQLLRSSSSGGSGTGPGSDALIELLEPEPVGGRPEARVRLSVKGSVAQLRGLARRLAVPDADEYEELEHRAAVTELEQSVKAACELLSSSGSGMVLPWALRVRLAEILLRGIFDTLDAGRYIDDKDEFLELLTTMLWPVLRISPELHEACLAWAHFRQLASSGDTRLIPATQDHLQSLILPKDAAAAPNQPSAPSEETRLRQQARRPDLVGLVAVIWLRQRMEDYHSSFPAAAGLDSMAALYMFALQLQGRSSSAQRDSSPLEELEAAVRSSVAAAVQRSWRAAEAASTGSEQGLLAFFDAVREMLEMEVEQFAPVLRTQLPLACSCALATAHAEVGLRYQAWLVAFKTLRPEAAEVLREAHELELWMAQEMDQDAAAAGVSDPPPGCILDQPWLTLRRAEPVVHHWVLTQNQALSQWLYRLLDQESWKPCNARMQTASIVELLRLAHEALRSLISFDLPLSLSVVRAMVEGLDGVLGSFAERASAQLPDPSIMVPPLPLLTRFKQRLALRGEQAEHRAGGGTGGTGGAAASGAGSGASFMEDGVLPVEMEECYPQVHPLDPEALTTLLCTLHALTEGLDGLRKEVREYVGASSNPFEATPKAGRGGPAVQRLHAADGPSSSGSGAAAWMDGLLEGAQQASVAAAEQVARFAAVKMVFWDLRQLWLWELYRYRVSTTRMGQVGLLRALDACLTQQVGDLPDAVRDSTALQILRATCVILLRILLDGGPARLFVPDDVALIEQDLLALQELFVGGGDGLEAAVVQQVLEPVREVLAVMGLDTGLLIANFDEAAKSAPRKAAHGVLQDAEMLKKMLSHRADRAASKFLKQEFKLPKRADGDNPIGRLLKTGAAAGRHGLG